jgi:hypothetical protein
VVRLWRVEGRGRWGGRMEGGEVIRKREKNKTNPPSSSSSSSSPSVISKSTADSMGISCSISSLDI